MGGGGSSSSSSTTSTNQEDKRVTASDSAIAIGAGGTLQITDEFSDNVKEFGIQLLEFAQGAGEAAIEFANKAQDTTQESLDRVAERAKQAEGIENAEKKALLQIVSIVGLGTLGGIVILAVKKKGRK